MSVDKIYPKDLFEGVSTSELALENSLKIMHVKAGENVDLLSLDPGTLAIVCTAGGFSCKALDNTFRILGGQVLLVSVEDLQEVMPLITAGFGGTIIYASENLLINRQRLMYRNITPEEIDEMRIYLQLIDAHLQRMSDLRAKIVESLVRSLVLSLQQNGHMVDTRDSKIPPLFHDFASLITRFHHEPVYFFAEKLGMTTHELNLQCKYYSDMSAAEWISKFVLFEAKDLLSKTRLRPSQIATMLRFSNYDTFARWFRRHTRELPSNWR